MLESIRLLLLLAAVAVVHAQTVCYSCWGNSTQSGQFCSIDKVCAGTSCYFRHESSGQWSAGCETKGAEQKELKCQLNGGVNSACSCQGDFCNSFTLSTKALRDFWPKENPFDTFTFNLPSKSPIMCMECGNVTVDGLYRNIECNEKNLCNGDYCVTKRGQSPHSYCGSNWEGNNTPQCYKTSQTTEEKCVCPQQMCNAVLPPEMLRSTTTTTTTMKTPAPQPTDALPTEKPSTKCKNGKFSPNAQAVFMGDKLKEVIMKGFGGGGQAVQEFQQGINEHICNYSEDE